MTPHKAEPRDWAVAILGFAAAVATSLALTACNTTEGAGEDLEEAGEAIQDEADDVN